MVRASWVSCALSSVSAIDSAVDSLESGCILQTTKLGSMNLAVEDGPAFLSEAWFIAEVEGFQASADTLSENFDTCRDQNANKDLRKTAHDDHGLCRVEQLAMASLNAGKECEDSKKEDCDHMQSMYEKAVCASDQSCQECHTGVSQAIAQLKKLESSNQGLYVMVLGKHTCEIRNHREGTNVDCDDVQPETPLPSVTYPSEPDGPCSSPSTLPGGPGWSLEEYSGQNWSKLVADVSPCPPGPGTQTRFVKRTAVGHCRFVGWHQGLAASGGYCATKTGQRGFTDVSCAELGLSQPDVMASSAGNGHCLLLTKTTSPPSGPAWFLGASDTHAASPPTAHGPLPTEPADLEYEGAFRPGLEAARCQIFGERQTA